MAFFILKRVLTWIPSILVVMFGIYALAFYGAGDPIKLMFLSAPGDVAYDPARIDAIREVAGLNRPFLAQFGSYLWNLLHGDLGNSLVSGRAVSSIIAVAAPVSLQLGLVTIVVTALVGVPLGMACAFHQGRALDNVVTSVALLLWAVPAYVIGPLMLVSLIILRPGETLPIGWGGLTDPRVILPVLVLALQPIALIQRQTRAAVIDILSENFIRTAIAKGVPRFRIAVDHVMRPVLTPIVTQLGIILITFINGAIFVEVVFGLPGLGRLTISAMTDSDYPVIMALVLIGTVAVLSANLLVEVLYPLLDPRVQAR
ncbi:ABC transporter permease [Aliirhizobium smilacinae]|uniref:ABC transporter permease n=1 Tax=Aliirhizobium smilacinae TaxID=1395944 RepID=A0A5C4XKD4_9HYPH|nr:ABC transporter permease [Rhizobium smilacinae]TNM63727.1 ABC transporter permease [Rhizobium smilacinae]